MSNDSEPGDYQALPWSHRWTYAKEIALAMYYLHSRDLLHHDLKSQNVLVGADGHVRVSDFGLSVTKTETLSRMSNQRGSGTPQWLAPEVLDGHTFTKRADVFRCGSVCIGVHLQLWDGAV